MCNKLKSTPTIMKYFSIILFIAFATVETLNAQTLIFKGSIEDFVGQFNPIPTEYTVAGKIYLEWLEHPTESYESFTENTVTIYDSEMNSVKRFYIPCYVYGSYTCSASEINIFGSDSGEDNLFVSSQTLFNDDDDFEYIRLERAASDNDCFSGFSVMSSNGTVLSYTPFSILAEEVSFYAFHSDTHNLLMVELDEDDDHSNYSSLVYVYKIDKSTSGVKQVQSFQQAKTTPVVEVKNGEICISKCSKGRKINIYDIDGALVKTVKATSNNTVISGLKPSNTYVVEIGGKSVKIVV